jgi:aminopeptidase N
MATEKSFHHLWLSEGFATYMTHQYMESRYGDSLLKQRLQSDREKINEFLSRTPRSVIDTTSNYMSLLNANSYEKGGWVLHMIRKQVGDETFHKIIRTYYEQYRSRNADTDDFRRVVEGQTGLDWSVFFNQWLTQKTNPSLQIEWSNSVDGKWVTLNTRQLQSGEPFTFPLSIDLVNSKGEKKRIKIQLSKKAQPIVIPTDGSIESLIIDPDTEILIDKLIVFQKE